MQSPEKRRGGSHVLRTGPSTTTRHVHASAATTTTAGGNAVIAGGGGGGGGGGGSAGGGSGSGDNLPAPPPKAAVVSGAGAGGTSNTSNNTSTGPDHGFDGPSPVERRDKDKEAGRSTTSPSTSSTAAGKERSHRDVSHHHQHHQQQQQLQQLQQQLHDRDALIARLESDAAETSSFWQSKHSALHRQFLDSDTALRLLRSAHADLVAERDELRRARDALGRDLRERDDEARRQRVQIRGLKDFVSTSTRVLDGQTSDEVFGDGMARLANGLQNWVIVHFRKARIDLTNADEAVLAELGDLSPLYEELTATAKIHMLQSIVSKILVESVFSAYFVGLSDEETRHFTQMERLLASFAASDEAVNQWRSSTLALVRRDASHVLQAETSAFVEAIIARINRVLDAITAAPTQRSEEARDSALRVLINNSVELARLLVVQRAVLRVYMPEVLPHQRVRFEPDTMEDVGGLEEDALAEREIGCVVFPGVIKHGDENGGHMQFRNVIAKARVLCSTGD